MFSENINDAELTDKETITQLATLTPLQYDRIRIDAAKLLKVRPSTLDNMVKLARFTD